MNAPGQIELLTQARVLKLLKTLGYDFLGNWIGRVGNANIEPSYLKAWLTKQGVSADLITRALHDLDKTACCRSDCFTVDLSR